MHWFMLLMTLIQITAAGTEGKMYLLIIMHSFFSQSFVQASSKKNMFSDNFACAMYLDPIVAQGATSLQNNKGFYYISL